MQLKTKFSLLIFTLVFITASSVYKVNAQSTSLNLTLSTYLGGDTDGETMRDIFIDDAGYIYTALTTGSSDLPRIGPRSNIGYAGTCSQNACGHGDIYIAKWDPSGQNIIWSSYLGGQGADEVYGVAVDNQGNVILSGRATGSTPQNPLSVPFPITQEAFQTQFMGCTSCGGGGGHGVGQDAFVAKFSSTGNLLWASYFGHSAGSDVGRDIAVDQSGNIYLVAHHHPTASTIYPYDYPSQSYTQSIFKNSPAGGGDAAVVKINSSNTNPQVEWIRFIGGSGGGGEESIKVDSNGNPVIATPDASLTLPNPNFDPPNPTQHGPGGSYDIYVVKLNSSGQVTHSAIVGGSSAESSETNILAVDQKTDRVILASLSTASDFPTTQGAFQQTYRGSAPPNCGNHCGDAIIAVLSPDLSILEAATYYGGSGGETAEGVAVDGDSNIIIGGGTFSGSSVSGASTPLVVTPNAFQASHYGNNELDSFVAKFSPDLSQLLYASYIGGAKTDYGRSLWVNLSGVVVQGGQTTSSNFPTLNCPSPTSMDCDTTRGDVLDSFFTIWHPNGDQVETSGGGDGGGGGGFSCFIDTAAGGFLIAQ